MKHSVFVTALIVLALGCGAAWAADPAATTAYNWTGFYVGLNTGVAKNNSRYSVSEEYGFSFLGSFDNPAFTVGGQAGYNYQVGNFVYGLETDINYEGPSPQLDYFGTLRGRLGYTPADRLLLYVTGGLAYGYVSSSTNYYININGSDHFTRSSSGMQVGWAVGVGGEYALTNNWSVKLEYLYVDLGSMSYTYAGAFAVPASTFTTTINTAQNVIRVGLNYKF